MIPFSFSSLQASLVSPLALFQSHGLFLPNCCHTHVLVYVHVYQMYYFADLWPITKTTKNSNGCCGRGELVFVSC